MLKGRKYKQNKTVSPVLENGASRSKLDFPYRSKSVQAVSEKLKY